MDNQQLAQGIASLGRYGDNTLVHMSKEEVDNLNTIGKAHGISLSVNPDTGLPEAFDFGGVLRFGANVAAAAYGVPIEGLMLANAGYDIASGQDLGTTALNAASAWGAGKLGEGISGFEVAKPVEFIGNVPTAEVVSGPTGELGAFNAPSQAGTTAFGSNIPSATASSSLGFTPFDQVPGGAGRELGAFNAQSQLGNTAFGSNIGAKPVNEFVKGTTSGTQIATDIYNGPSLVKGFEAVAHDPMGFAKEYGYGKTAMGLGGGLMAGLEASDIAPEPLDINALNKAEAYDPTRRLSLNYDTGLRLLSSGGQIKRYANGGQSSRDYGVEPKFKGILGSGIGGLNGNQGMQRVPVKGFIDVGGHFKASPDGDITDVEYEKGYSAMWDPKEKYGSVDIPSFAANQMGQVPAGVGSLIGNVVSSVGEARDSAPSESQSLQLESLAKGGRVRYADGGNIMSPSLDPHLQQSGYGLSRLDSLARNQSMATGYAEGGISELDNGTMLSGDGDGVSDEIPAMIEGEQEAALSDGEFIVPARIVSELGNGSSDAGAKKLYEMIDRIQAARKQTIGDKKQYSKDTNAERYLPA